MKNKQLLAEWIIKPFHTSYLGLLHKFITKEHLPGKIRSKIIKKFLRDPIKYFRGEREEFCLNPELLVLKEKIHYLRKQTFK